MKIYAVMNSKDSFWCRSLNVDELIDFVDFRLEEDLFEELMDNTLFSYLNTFRTIHCDIEGCSKSDMKIFLTQEEYETEICSLKGKIELMGATLK